MLIVNRVKIKHVQFSISCMKEKLVRTPFDQNTFEDKVHERYLGYMGELQRCADKKLELFIQVNHFQSILEDSMEFLLKTDQGRGGMKTKKIIRILFERGILDEKDAKVAIKITQIRNFFSHESDTPNIQADAEKIINKIEIDIPTIPPLLNFPETDIKELMKKTISEWDMYQKLDFIIHGLVLGIENKVHFLKD